MKNRLKSAKFHCSTVIPVINVASLLAKLALFMTLKHAASEQLVQKTPIGEGA